MGLWIFFLLTIPLFVIFRLICFRSKMAGWYESRWRWDCTIKGFCVVFQHGICSAIYRLQKTDISVKYRSGFAKNDYNLAYSFLILSIFGVVVICAFTLIIILVHPKNRRTCFFFGGMFHDILTEDWK